MNFNKVNFYKTFLIVILLSQIYIPSFKFNIFLQLISLMFFVFYEKPLISKKFLKYIYPLITIFLFGFIGMIIFTRPIGLALKDIFHFIKPIQGIFIGYLFFKIINNQKEFIRTILITAVISSIIHICIVVFFTDFASGSIHSIRKFTRDNYLELFAFFFLFYYNFFFKSELFNSKFKKRLFLIILLISCITYFSRTMMVAAIILLLSIYGFTKINTKSVKIICVAIITVGLFYAYLFSVKIDRDGNGLEAFLYKIKIAPSELFETKIDRSNHKDLWDHWRGYEAKRAFALMNQNPISYLTGTGYGSLVNLRFNAPLGEGKKGMKYISELHNGYPYILYKSGVFALLFYLIFLTSMYKKIYIKFCFETVFISALALFYFFTTLTITGLFNTNDTMIFVLGALLASFIQSNKKNEI